MKGILMKTRIIKSVALAGGLIVALSGCADLSLSINLEEDGDATMTQSMSLEKSVVEAMGTTPEEYQERMMADLTDRAGVKYTPTETEDTIGYTGSFEGVWKGEESIFTGETTAEAPIPISITEDGDNIVASLPVFDGSEEGADPKLMEEMLNSFDISITFPGNAKSASHNGVVDSNTVTWDLDSVIESIDSKEPLVATGAASASEGISLLYWVLGGVLGVLVLALVFTLVRKAIKVTGANKPDKEWNTK